jgi:hypothetical protein
MTRPSKPGAARRVLAAGLLAATAGLTAAAPAASAADTAASAVPAANAGPTLKARVPAANFFVEWRIRPASESAQGGGLVVSSRSATTGGSGFGPGAVVVGTAQGAAPPGAQDAGVQGVRVANGREATLRLDRRESHMVYDMSWSGRARGAASAPGGGFAADAGGASGYEVVVHRVEGLRVTPLWTHGDTLQLDLGVTRTGHPGDERDLELTSIVEIRLDEWLAVARLGAAGDELQVRVSRR